MSEGMQWVGFSLPKVTRSVTGVHDHQRIACEKVPKALPLSIDNGIFNCWPKLVHELDSVHVSLTTEQVSLRARWTLSAFWKVDLKHRVGKSIATHK